MNLKRFFQIVVSIVATILIINVSLVWGLLSNQEKLNQASQLQTESANMLSFYRMVNEITVRLIRQYAVTGNEEARRQYDDILEVIFGRKPWPTGKTMSSSDYMAYLGFPQQAFDLLGEAAALAKPIAEGENIAYHAMQGKFQDDDGKFTVLGDVNQPLAIEVLHSFDYQQAADAMQPFYEQLMDVVAADKQRQVDELYNASIRSGIYILVFSGLSIVMLILAYLLVTRRILTPLEEMVVMTEAVAQGDLTVSSSAQGGDEIGRFGRAFNLMVASLEALLHQVADIANRVDTAALSLSRDVDETRERAERQQRDTDQVATAINEMSSAAQGVAYDSARTAEAGHQASSAATAGHGEVTQVIEVIGRLADQVHNASDQIIKLESHAGSVSNVLNVIQGVAEQTNLLALNAAIEAARAGDQGRGFAVVADEVRTLAQRTQESTSEIQLTIEQLMEGTHGAVAVMQSSTAVASEAVLQAKHTGESLDKIAESVEKIDTMTVQIATAAQQQSTVVDETDSLLVSISDVTTEAADNAVRTSQSAKLLGEMSAALQKSLSSFNIG